MLAISNDEMNSTRHGVLETCIGIIRVALDDWFARRKARKMADGYRAMNAENKLLMDEFNEIDRKNL